MDVLLHGYDDDDVGYVYTTIDMYIRKDFQERYGKLQQKNPMMAADQLFYTMLQDKYCFVLYDGRFTQFQVFRISLQIMWTFVVIRYVVEGVSRISEVPDWWLRPGKRKFTVNINGNIANHGKAI